MYLHTEFQVSRLGFIKIIFDIKIEIGMSEISNVPNFNKFRAFLILVPIWA